MATGSHPAHLQSSPRPRRTCLKHVNRGYIGSKPPGKTKYKNKFCVKGQQMNIIQMVSIQVPTGIFLAATTSYPDQILCCDWILDLMYLHSHPFAWIFNAIHYFLQLSLSQVSDFFSCTPSLRSYYAESNVKLVHPNPITNFSSATFADLIVK